MNITKEKLSKLVGEFIWSFGKKWFIETAIGNFEWSDPDYTGGTGEIVVFDGTYKDWLRLTGIPFGRDKSKHIIKEYCGNFIFNNEIEEKKAMNEKQLYQLDIPIEGYHTGGMSLSRKKPFDLDCFNGDN